ncbi:hypothetical protein Amal_00613 [Acetobacter malorum]|uniref:Uncharacterized protein n=1 Tax=Acetobacter malorum TaxID=178901 RepID=A0A177GFI2_9PROT|nr:hypothetical protein Amal_00613 [Acetobacter malorum]
MVAERLTRLIILRQRILVLLVVPEADHAKEQRMSGTSGTEG